MNRLQLLLLFYISFCFEIFANGDNAAGARSGAMGGASATSSDVWSVLNNQAGLALLRNPYVGVNYSNKFLIEGLGGKSAAFALPSKWGTFGAGITSFGITGYTENKYSLAYAKALSEKFSVGLSLDYFSLNLGENYGSRKFLTGGIGTQYKLNPKVTLAFHLSNLSKNVISTYNNERLSSILNLGASYKFSEKGEIVAELEKDINFKPVLKTGVEYKPSPIFYLRAGFSSDPSLFSFGFGLEIKSLRLDIASSMHPVLGHSPQAGLSYHF